MTDLLYELQSKDRKYIRDSILKYNEYGFYTITSQPGTATTHANIERRQRAYVRGYMSIHMANYIILQLNHIPTLFIRSELHNKVLNSNIECTCGSVEFKDGQPCTMDFNVGDYNQSFNFNLPLRRPFNIMNYTETDFINKNVFHEDLTEFDILDLRWNENDMWHILLKCIMSYHKQKQKSI